MLSLRNVLFVNGFSSGVTGVGLTFFAHYLADLFAIPNMFYVSGTGVFLVGFATVALYESLQKASSINRIRFIITLDILWVMISLIIVVMHLYNLSTLAYGAIGAVGIWVAAMAYLQIQGLRRVIRSCL